jgi:hypothetical protein
MSFGDNVDDADLLMSCQTISHHMAPVFSDPGYGFAGIIILSFPRSLSTTSLLVRTLRNILFPCNRPFSVSNQSILSCKRHDGSIRDGMAWRRPLSKTDRLVGALDVTASHEIGRMPLFVQCMSRTGSKSQGIRQVYCLFKPQGARHFFRNKYGVSSCDEL